MKTVFGFCDLDFEFKILKCRIMLKKDKNVNKYSISCYK